MRKRVLSYSFVLLATSVFLFLSETTLSPAGCDCGANRGKLEYDAPDAEVFTPEATMTGISFEAGSEVLHISVETITKHDEVVDLRLRSDDNGATWKREGAKTKRYRELSRASVIYRSAPNDVGGLERSQNGGQEWHRAALQITGEHDVATKDTDKQVIPEFQLSTVHPKDPLTIFGCFRQPNAVPGMFVSHDGGDHWSIFAPELVGDSLEQRCFLAISSFDPRLMVGSGKGGLLVSVDGGGKWKLMGGSTELESPATLKGYAEQVARGKARGGNRARAWPFSWTYLVVASVEFVHGSDSIFYLVTNKGLYKTYDQGRSWCLLDTGAPKLFEVRSLYIDERDPNRIFVTVGSKVLVSADAGCHFKMFFDATKAAVRKVPPREGLMGKGTNTVGGLFCCSLLVATPLGPASAHSGEPPRVEILIERVERVSREEVHFRLKVSNPSERPVFLNGIKYQSERHPYPLYLEHWQTKEAWKIVVPCMDTAPPDVIKLDAAELMIEEPVLKLPLEGVCKERNIRLVGKFRFRLDYFDSERQARAYIEKLFSPRWKEARAPAAFSEPFEIPPPPDP